MMFEGSGLRVLGRRLALLVFTIRIPILGSTVVLCVVLCWC